MCHKQFGCYKPFCRFVVAGNFVSFLKLFEKIYQKYFGLKNGSSFEYSTNEPNLATFWIFSIAVVFVPIQMSTCKSVSQTVWLLQTVLPILSWYFCLSSKTLLEKIYQNYFGLQNGSSFEYSTNETNLATFWIFSIAVVFVSIKNFSWKSFFARVSATLKILSTNFGYS